MLLFVWLTSRGTCGSIIVVDAKPESLDGCPQTGEMLASASRGGVHPASAGLVLQASTMLHICLSFLSFLHAKQTSTTHLKTFHGALWMTLTNGFTLAFDLRKDVRFFRPWTRW